MKTELQDEIFKNIVENLKLLTEESIDGGTGTNAQADNSGPPTDENLSLPVMYQQLATPSLARSVLFDMPLHGPTGALFNMRKKVDTVELVRSEVEVFPSNPIKTGISVEAMEDMKRQFGVDGVKSVAILLQGLANEDENDKLITFLASKAVAADNLDLSNSGNAYDNFIEIQQHVSDIVIQMNMKGRRTFKSAVLLPYKLAASIMASSGWLNKFTSNSNEFYMGGNDLIEYYINPDITATSTFVILKDRYNGSKSAGSYSSYTNYIQESIDSETGDLNYIIYNRFALGISPLHEVTNPMIMSFTHTL